MEELRRWNKPNLYGNIVLNIINWTPYYKVTSTFGLCEYIRFGLGIEVSNIIN